MHGSGHCLCSRVMTMMHVFLLRGGGALPVPSPRHRYINQVGRGLLALSRERFVHLDIKPNNIVLRSATAGAGDTSYPVPVLVDFGLARRLHDSSLALVCPTAVWAGEQLWGNQAHVAPELLREHQRVLRHGGTATFNFSKQATFELGVLAYEICAGEHPIGGYPAVVDYTEEDVVPFPVEYPEALRAVCAPLVRACWVEVEGLQLG
jgi:serine/threonine protein kinase